MYIYKKNKHPCILLTVLQSNCVYLFFCVPYLFVYPVSDSSTLFVCVQLSVAKKQGLRQKAALLDSFNVWFKEQLKFAPQPEVSNWIKISLQPVILVTANIQMLLEGMG